MATGVAGSLVHRIPKKLCAILWRSVAACLAVLALSGHPTRLVTVGEPQQVETLHPKIGLHTRLTDEVEEWKIQRSLQMVREMGASWIVEYFPWAYYEPRR
ncbi:MAG: hypothetical protein GXY79_04780, partial [Chloroflexi bacterium]|nr:hypothetical protein [Chloroflexota bacterium]